MRKFLLFFWSVFTIGAIVLVNHCYGIHTRNQARDSDKADLQHGEKNADGRAHGLERRRGIPGLA